MRVGAVAGDHLGSRRDRIGSLYVGTLRPLPLWLLLLYVLGGRGAIDDRAPPHARVPFLVELGLAIREMVVIGRYRRCDVGVSHRVG